MDLTEQAIEKMLATGRSQNQVILPDYGDPFTITPAGLLLDLSKQYPPRWLKQTVKLQDAKSFCDYVNRFKDDDTVIFSNVSPTAASFEAVMDYHIAPSPLGGADVQRCGHRALFTTQATEEWKVWQAANRKAMTQVEFATWLEDNLSLFVTPKEQPEVPSGAPLLELIRTLHGHQNARFNTNLRLNTGAFSVAYEEDVEVNGTIATKPGSIALPPIVVAGFSIFEGSSPYEVPARLKTRIESRRLMIHFETIALHKIVRESIDAIVAQVAEQTKIVPLIGTPG